MTRQLCLPFVVSLLLLALASCAPAVTTPIAAKTATPASPASPTPTLVPTAQPLSFIPVTYKDETHGFELDYPSGWSLDPNSQIGSRGQQAQLFSPGTTAETLAPGGTRISLTIFQWDPKNDLAAFVAQHKSAWGGSGSQITKDSQGTLVDGRQEMHFIVKTPDNLQAFFLFTTNGEQYLQIAGEGDLALIEEVARTLRPLNFKP